MNRRSVFSSKIGLRSFVLAITIGLGLCAEGQAQVGKIVAEGIEALFKAGAKSRVNQAAEAALKGVSRTGVREADEMLVRFGPRAFGNPAEIRSLLSRQSEIDRTILRGLKSRRYGLRPDLAGQSLIEIEARRLDASLLASGVRKIQGEGDDVVRSLSREAESSPIRALEKLGISQPGLSKIEQARLTRVALGNLEASMAGTSPTSIQALIFQRLRGSWSTRQQLAMPDEVLRVARLELEVRGQLRGQALDDLGRLMDAREWNQVVRQGKTRLVHESLSREGDTLLREVVDQAEARQVAKAWEAAVDLADDGFARVWRGSLPAGPGMPAAIRDMARRRASLGEIKAAVLEIRPREIAADQIRQDLDALGEMTGDLAAARALQEDLAFKAFLVGDSAKARALLPTDGPPEHAAALLADAKAWILGEGRVSTWPSRQAAEAASPLGLAGPRGPPPMGIRLVVPDAPVIGYRPAIAGESVTADLPRLEVASGIDDPAHALGTMERSEADKLRGSLRVQSESWDATSHQLRFRLDRLARGKDEDEQDRHRRASMTVALDLRAESLLEAADLRAESLGDAQYRDSKREILDLLSYVLNHSPGLQADLRTRLTPEEMELRISESAAGRSVPEVIDSIFARRLGVSCSRLVAGQYRDDREGFTMKAFFEDAYLGSNPARLANLMMALVAEYQTTTLFDDPFRY